MHENAASGLGDTDGRFDQEVLGAGGPAWAPADACTLPTAEQPLRETEFDALFATALRGVERPEPTWLRLNLDAGADVEARTRDLIARESSCCSFFGFSLAAGEDGLTLDVRVPEARTDVLDGLARRADTARTDAGTEPGTITRE